MHSQKRLLAFLRSNVAIVLGGRGCFISEIILLDFHRFPNLGHGPPHEAAAVVVLDVLREVMIQPRHRNLPLGRLLSEQSGRVGVLWNAREVRFREGGGKDAACCLLFF